MNTVPKKAIKSRVRFSSRASSQLSSLKDPVKGYEQIANYLNWLFNGLADLISTDKTKPIQGGMYVQSTLFYYRLDKINNLIMVLSNNEFKG